MATLMLSALFSLLLAVLVAIGLRLTARRDRSKTLGKGKPVSPEHDGGGVMGGHPEEQQVPPIK